MWLERRGEPNVTRSWVSKGESQELPFAESTCRFELPMQSPLTRWEGRSNPMNRRISRIFGYPAVAALLIFVPHLALAGNILQLSGSYQVVGKPATGPQTRIRLHIHLVNRGSRDLKIQRLAFWSFSHPGQSQACSISLHTDGSADATQDFTVPRPEYELWLRGARPRLILEVLGSSGRRTTEVVRLDRVSGGKAD